MQMPQNDARLSQSQPAARLGACVQQPVLLQGKLQLQQLLTCANVKATAAVFVAFLMHPWPCRMLTG